MARVGKCTTLFLACFTTSVAFPESSIAPILKSPVSSLTAFSLFGRKFRALYSKFDGKFLRQRRGITFDQRRWYPRTRGHIMARCIKDLALNVDICIEEGLPDDHEILNIAELLRLNVPTAMKLAFEAIKESTYRTRNAAISDVGGFESIELSVLLCNDEFIHKLNKEWRNEDHSTDVLSLSQHLPDLNIPILMLGDIVISVETALRQAEERGYMLVDEIRVLMVHGLLHLLGFDHETSEEAEAEMESLEGHLLKMLGWKGKGLIHNSYDSDERVKDRKQEGSLRFYKSKFSYLFCDMDGTLLNSSSQISLQNAEALKEASSRGLKVVVATGKGLLVYGKQGLEIYQRSLDHCICREACLYSLKNRVPLIAFSRNSCFSLFDHPFIDAMHTFYHEPKAEIVPSVEHLLAVEDIQKLVFHDTEDRIKDVLRPHWSEVAGTSARVVQAVSNVLEIVPAGTSKGNAVKLLLDHFGSSPTEVMAIGDGENDVEMLQLASLGIALSNGCEKAKVAANVVGLSNDEDGVADAIYRYAF